MKIILQKDNPSLGPTGKIVTVKDGYARNYLIPQGWAVKADTSALKAWNELKKVEERKQSKDRRKAEKMINELTKISLTIKGSAGEDDKVFGAVTSQDIAQALSEKGFEIDRRKIELENPIKELGVYIVSIKMHHEISAKVKVWVIKE